MTPALWRLRSTASHAAPVGLGTLLSTAFEPLAWPYAIPICVAGLALTLQGRGVLRAGLRTAEFGAAFMLTTLVWLWPSIGLLAWLGLSLVQALWFFALGCGLRFVRGVALWPLWSAALWSIVETMRGAWPLGGFPWARLGTSVIDTPWAPLLPLLGVSGTGLALALLGFVLAAVLESAPRRRPAMRRWAPVLALGVAAPVVSSAGSEPDARPGSMTVAVVQGGVPGDGTDVARNHRTLTRHQQEATAGLAARVRAGQVPPPGLVVWPENSTAVDPFVDPEARAAVDAAVGAIGSPLLVGAMVDAVDPRRVLSQAVVWDDTRGPGERYTKRHPVPFGEYIPYRGLLGGIHPRLAEIPRDMIPGGAQSPLEIGGRTVALAICFDVAYDDVLPVQVRRGAELIVVQTSNAMFTGTSQRAQQFAISRARALETGRSVVIASTNGISGVIGPGGAVLERSQTRGTEVLVSEVPLVSKMTLAVRLAPWYDAAPIVLTLAGLLLGCGAAVTTRREAARRDLAAAPPERQRPPLPGRGRS